MYSKSSNDNSKLECTIYKNEPMNEYIYKLDVNIPNLGPPEFIFIVDKSGSMGSSCGYIISKTIPHVLQSLGYGTKKIHLIAFDQNGHYKNISASELGEFKCPSKGKTFMSKSYDILDKILSTYKHKCNNFRILVISDGILHDQDETKEKGELFYKKYKNTFKINSQCIRLYTSSKEPDTSGIMSILKFNNVKDCNLISYKNKQISSLENIIIQLFKDDGLFECNYKIMGYLGNLKNFPWEQNCLNSIPFKNGKYVLFSDKKMDLYLLNDKNIFIPIKCKNGEEINNSNYESIVGKEKLNNMDQRSKLTKMLNNKESKEENKLISNYFENLRKNTKKENKDNNNLEFYNQKIRIFNEVDKNKINQLDENSKALCVKQIDESKEIKKYEKNYNDEDFWSKVKKFGKKIGLKPLYSAFYLYYSLSKVSFVDKALIIGSLGYLISPFDLIPDVIPVIGFLDDASALMFAFYRIHSSLKNKDKEVREQALERLKSIFGDFNEDEIKELL